jgi:Gas vesicle synthesis protein GvpO
MARTTAQAERAEGRAQRRSQASQPPDLEEVFEDEGPPSPSEALRTAASAAIAGAAVGAAQALARHRHAQTEEEPEDDEPELDDAEPVSETAAPSDAAAREAEDGAEESQARPLPPGDAHELVARAREHLRDLRGAEAETVSSIRRSADGWCVALEVVELRRVPETTDVLGTYEVTLDDDGNLLSFDRIARYYRSEAARR